MPCKELLLYKSKEVEEELVMVGTEEAAWRLKTSINT